MPVEVLPIESVTDQDMFFDRLVTYIYVLLTVPGPPFLLITLMAKGALSSNESLINHRGDWQVILCASSGKSPSFAPMMEDFQQLLSLAGDILIVISSYKLTQTILDYLKSKPPGLQSPIDQVNKYLLTSMQMMNIDAFIIHAIHDIHFEVGDLGAKIISWIVFNGAEIFGWLLIINTLAYQSLVLFPHWIELSFEKPLKILVALGLVYQVGICLTFHHLGYFLPAYYTMRQIPMDNDHPFMIYHPVTKATSLALICTARILVRWWVVDNTQEDMRIISDKSLIMVAAFVPIPALISKKILGIDRVYIEKYALAIIMVVWPLFIILSNHQVREFAERQVETLFARLRSLPTVFRRRTNAVHSINV